MNVNVVCLLVCLTVTVGVQTADTDTPEQSADMILSRHKRGFIDDLLGGLANKFTETVDKVLSLKKGEFVKIVKGVKKLGVAVAKKIFGLFKDFSSHAQDLDGEKAGRVSALMDALDEDIKEKEAAADSGSSLPWISVISVLVSLVCSVMCV